MTTQEYIALRAPELTIDARVDSLVDVADSFKGCLTGDRAEMAKGLLVLHWLTLSYRSNNDAQGGAIGGVVSEKEGDLQVSYGGVVNTSNLSDNALAQTSWGLEYESLMKSCMLFPRTRFS